MELLGLDAARTIVDAALAEGRRRDAEPLAVALLGVGGNVKLLAAEDGTGLSRGDIAVGKAWSALSMGSGTRALVERRKERPASYEAVSNAVARPLVAMAGGVLIRDGQRIVGALGISGDVGDVDEQCAIAGIEAAGLTAQPD